MSKSPLWIFITLGIFLGVSQSFFFLTPIVILSYFIFIKKILLKENLKDSFFAGWSFGVGFYIGSMHWIIYPFLIYDKHLFLSPISIFFPLLTIFLHALTMAIPPTVKDLDPYVPIPNVPLSVSP